MAKITAYIPEPSVDHNYNNEQQKLQALETIKNQLNTSFQEELKQEVERFNWFLAGSKC